MADMTHKHHNLIYDAIEDGISSFLDSLEWNTILTLTDGGFTRKKIIRSVVKSLAASFSHKLRYTNDKFDSMQWQAQVENIADEVYNKWESSQPRKSREDVKLDSEGRDSDGNRREYY